MMRLSFFSPGLVDFYEVVGIARSEPDLHADLWNTAAERVPDVVRDLAALRGATTGVRADVARARRASRFNRFRTIDQDALERPLEAMVLTVSGTLVASAPPDSGLRIDGDVVCRLFDHGVFVIEGALQRVCDGDADRDCSTVLDDAQQDVIAYVADVAAQVHRDWLVPVVDALRTLDPAASVIDPAGSRPSRSDRGFGEVLWVTRGLVADSRESGSLERAQHWVKDVVDDPRRIDQMFADEEHGCVVRWFNHLFVVHDDEQLAAGTAAFADVWTAMRYGQYFWAALEELDRDLTDLLAFSLTPRLASVRSMRTALEESAHRAQFALIELTELQKALTRGVHQELAALLEFWDFDAVVRQSVEHKVSACDRRLGEISEVRRARSDLFTDLILLTIGITSILGTTLAVSEFGRVMAGDPDMAGFDLGRSSLTTWLAAQPADFMVLASSVVSVSLVVLYLYFRRARDL